ARLELDPDLGRPGVQGVLDQLLDHRRRALDDLARGDLRDQGVREMMNARHRSGILASLRGRIPDRIAFLRSFFSLVERREEPRAAALARDRAERRVAVRSGRDAGPDAAVRE